MRIKRFLCFCVLLCCLFITAYALPKTDGNIGPREYNESFTVLQNPKNESNNELTYAYLHWSVSPADHSVYLGLQYKCRDYMLEEDQSAVRIFLNRELIGTIRADNTVEGVDHDRFELDAVFDDGAKDTALDHSASCEVRVGIKFWEEREIVAGFQVLDFSGNPSNYYAHLVYSPHTTTTHAAESTTKPPKTTTEKDTSGKTTTPPAAQTTARAPRTTVPVITASPNREMSAAAQTSRVTSAAVVPAADNVTTKAVRTTASKPKTTKTNTTESKTTKSPATERAETTTLHTVSEPPTTASFLSTTAAESSSAAAAAVAGAKMYSELNKVKIVGTVLVCVILTAAIMSSVFLGMHRKEEKSEPHTPQEEYDDFG